MDDLTRLVLFRRENESIRIGDDVTVTIVRASHGKVKLMVEAPRSVPIVRAELEGRNDGN